MLEKGVVTPAAPMTSEAKSRRFLAWSKWRLRRQPDQTQTGPHRKPLLPPALIHPIATFASLRSTIPSTPLHPRCSPPLHVARAGRSRQTLLCPGGHARLSTLASCARQQRKGFTPTHILPVGHCLAWHIFHHRSFHLRDPSTTTKTNSRIYGRCLNSSTSPVHPLTTLSASSAASRQPHPSQTRPAFLHTFPSSFC